MINLFSVSNLFWLFLIATWQLFYLFNFFFPHFFFCTRSKPLIPSVIKSFVFIQPLSQVSAPSFERFFLLQAFRFPATKNVEDTWARAWKEKPVHTVSAKVTSLKEEKTRTEKKTNYIAKKNKHTHTKKKGSWICSQDKSFYWQLSVTKMQENNFPKKEIDIWLAVIVTG